MLLWETENKRVIPARQEEDRSEKLFPAPDAEPLISLSGSHLPGTIGSLCMPRNPLRSQGPNTSTLIFHYFLK